MTGNMHGIDKLPREIVIRPTRHHQLMTFQTSPIEVADLVYNSRIAISYLDVHGLNPFAY